MEMCKLKFNWVKDDVVAVSLLRGAGTMMVTKAFDVSYAGGVIAFGDFVNSTCFVDCESIAEDESSLLDIYELLVEYDELMVM